MYNINFIMNDDLLEAKILAALTAEGVCWKRKGRLNICTGVSVEMRDLIMRKAAKVWCW